MTNEAIEQDSPSWNPSTSCSSKGLKQTRPLRKNHYACNVTATLHARGNGTTVYVHFPDRSYISILVRPGDSPGLIAERVDEIMHQRSGGFTGPKWDAKTTVSTYVTFSGQSNANRIMKGFNGTEHLRIQVPVHVS